LQIVLDSGAAPSHEAALASAEARVPKPAVLGEGKGLSIRSAWRDAGASKPRVLVDVAANTGAPDLFAEGPTMQWALPVPTIVAGAPAGLTRFAFDLDGAPPGATYAGAILKLTAVTPQQAIEVPFRLD
jgi:hypothetical protein